jgi:hypothetical protein
MKAVCMITNDANITTLNPAAATTDAVRLLRAWTPPPPTTTTTTTATNTTFSKQCGSHVLLLQLLEALPKRRNLGLGRSESLLGLFRRFLHLGAEVSQLALQRLDLGHGCLVLCRLAPQLLLLVCELGSRLGQHVLNSLESSVQPFEALVGTRHVSAKLLQRLVRRLNRVIHTPSKLGQL